LKAAFDRNPAADATKSNNKDVSVFQGEYAKISSSYKIINKDKQNNTLYARFGERRKENKKRKNPYLKEEEAREELDGYDFHIDKRKVNSCKRPGGKKKV